MILREVSSKDYINIKKLFRRNHLKMISLNRWNNLWLKNPILKDGKKRWVKGWILEQDKKVVGHVGNFPMKYFLNKKSYICAVLNGWVVDKKFRSNSILLVKKYFSQLNVDFFLGTSFNVKTSKIMQAMGVKEVPTDGLDNSLIIILKSTSVMKYFFGNKSFLFKNFFLNFLSILLLFFFKKRFNHWENKFSIKNIIQCKVIDKRFDALWKKIKFLQKNKMLFKRDTIWLKWHLDPFLKRKKAWIFLSIKDNKINGYTICIEKKNYKKGIKFALLIDLITLNDFDQTSKNLIGANIKEAKKRNCDIFEFRGFSEVKRSYMKFFKPFEKKLLLNPFYYKSKNEKLSKLLNNRRHWDPSYIDGDAIVNL
jgi:hypothetical protein